MPSLTFEPLASPRDHAACRASIRKGSKSFFAASLLLPAEVREAALALYAFCRVADDAVDCGMTRDPLRQLRERLDRAYQRTPLAIPADRAFADVVARYAIPKAVPNALLEGFEWDAAGRRYETISELQAYAARVAGTVGAMMACLMGARAPHVVARACDLGVAMQLTNIARDVGEDARAGRLYLPLEWLRDAGIEPREWRADATFTPALASVVARLLNVAESLYERATTGIAFLPRGCRPGIHAARYIYAEIGRELQRQGLDSVSRRAIVPTSRKAYLLTRAIVAAAASEAKVGPPALAETQFLVDAVVNESVDAVASSAGLQAALDGRVEWLVNLFERLEERDHAGAR
jgi:15-cis-phytoene synthase